MLGRDLGENSVIVRPRRGFCKGGLHLGVTTVGRILRETDPIPENVASSLTVIETQVVTAGRPGEIWHVGLAIFRDHPTAGDIQRFLSRAIRNARCSPKYIITDKGRQFWCDSFKRWCHRSAIRPRFGAVGKQGSVAMVERLMRSMKNECAPHNLVPLQLEAMRRELGAYAMCYNEHRVCQRKSAVRRHIAVSNERPEFGGLIHPAVFQESVQQDFAVPTSDCRPCSLEAPKPGLDGRGRPGAAPRGVPRTAIPRG